MDKVPPRHVDLRLRRAQSAGSRRRGSVPWTAPAIAGRSSRELRLPRPYRAARLVPLKFALAGLSVAATAISPTTNNNVLV